MTDALPVTVVILTWNSADVLPACLRGLADASPPPAELVVIDNASADDSVAIAQAFAADHPSMSFRLVANTRNRGFAGGANQGIDAASHDCVCLLNPDIRLRADTLAILAGSLRSATDEVAVVGGKLLRAEGGRLESTQVIDSTAIVMTRDGRHFDRGAGSVDLGQFDSEEDVFGITGALAMFRRSVLDAAKVDGQVFDEDFFAYREDADLAWRLQGFGYRAKYIPTAVAYHRRTVTPERRRSLSPVVNRHSVKNRFLLRIHHADGDWLIHFGLRSFVRDVVVIGACLTVERSSLPALRWLLRNWPRHVERRQTILRRRTARSSDLRKWFK